MPDPDRAEGAGGVVDEVGQRLRHRRARHRAEELVQLDRGPAGVERAAHRGGREPVDGRAAARLHVGDQLQPAGQLGLQRPGRDRGEVGLQQHVVDGLGQQRGQGLVRRLVLVGQQRAGVRRQAVEPGDPERGGLGERPGDLVGAGPRAARPLPAQQRHERRRSRSRRPGTRPRPAPSRAASVIARVSAMCTPASSGASAFQVLPAVSREPTRPGIRGLASQVRASPAQRSAGGRSTQASTSVGRQPDRVAGLVGGGRDQPGGRPRSRRAAPAVASSRCRAVAVAFRSRTPSPPLRSAAGGSAPHRSSSSSSRRTASNAAPAATPSTCCSRRARWWPAPARRRRGRAWSGRRAAPARPRRAPRRCRCRAGTSSRRESSSSAGVVASSGSTVCRPPSVVASPPEASDVLEHRPRRRGQLGQPGGDLRGRRLGGRSTAAAR